MSDAPWVSSPREIRDRVWVGIDCRSFTPQQVCFRFSNILRLLHEALFKFRFQWCDASDRIQIRSLPFISLCTFSRLPCLSLDAFSLCTLRSFFCFSSCTARSLSKRSRSSTALASRISCLRSSPHRRWSEKNLVNFFTNFWSTLTLDSKKLSWYTTKLSPATATSSTVCFFISFFKWELLNSHWSPSASHTKNCPLWKRGTELIFLFLLLIRFQHLP